MRECIRERRRSGWCLDDVLHPVVFLLFYLVMLLLEGGDDGLVGCDVAETHVYFVDSGEEFVYCVGGGDFELIGAIC